jgi:multidrug efflux pump subunit AcrB
MSIAERARDDWGENSFRVLVDVDPAKTGLVGLSNLDVAIASAGGFSGVPLNTLRDRDRTIPIVARLRYEERGAAAEIEDLYVLGSRAQKVPLGQIAKVSLRYAAEKMQRRNQRRTISVSCFPSPGFLPSEVMKRARPRLDEIAAGLPPGYRMEIGGSEENVLSVRKDSAVVAAVSLAAILLTLVLQFRHALKPLLVFAAIPYGVSGALVAIVVMGAPFGFTAILGTISLIGVIVSHVIVLFDYIEEKQEEGEALDKALLDAGTMRLRPVVITVGATVLGLVPLAAHGGPLWEPLCYAQIGGLTLATGITLVLVPILYAVFVRDLRWIRWGPPVGATTMRLEREPPAVVLADHRHASWQRRSAP